MTMLGVLLLSLTVLLLLAVPVAFALVLSATIAVVFVGDIDLMIVPQQVYQGLDRLSNFTTLPVWGAWMNRPPPTSHRKCPPR